MDPVANMITKIRNAIALKKTEVSIPYSQFKQSILEKLVTENFLDKVEVEETEGVGKELRVTLKYTSGKPAIRGLRRISKPGSKVYAKAKDIPNPRGGFGILVVSTPHGLLTNQEARRKHAGGEILCEVLS